MAPVSRNLKKVNYLVMKFVFLPITKIEQIDVLQLI